MRLHILGICGTFMGGIAALARELGFDVEGSDANVYPPMSTQLEQLGITLKQGYKAEHLQPPPDLIVVGNALSRGNAAIEHLLDARLRYVSGPQWLGETLLAQRRVLAVAGTHGKTTTTSLLAWILDSAGRDPGFLVGGVPANFGVSARLGSSDDFVIEADEYDTAFFDKRSKFVHYRPSVAILNNLEYDHADIFPDVAAIQRQFHHLVRIVPGNGRLVVNAEDERLAEVLAMGCWTPVETFGIDAGDWRARLLAADGSAFVVSHQGRELGEAHWTLSGRHNVMNALAAIAAAHAVGVDVADSIAALATFRNVAPHGARRRSARRARLRRLRPPPDRDRDHARRPARESPHGTHPRRHGAALELDAHGRACRRTRAVARRCGRGRVPATSGIALGRGESRRRARRTRRSGPSVDALIENLLRAARDGDHVVFMSNGGFENAPRRFAAALAAARA
jgi:UDP-N-acetylmuramate: L-alanyl-gamma-D-glutamyl-meso-diaminopimelate ligase